MKRLLIITVLIFGVLVAFGQKNVSDKENETAPKTALIEAQKDYQKAVKEKNSPLLIQSLIRQIKYQSLIDIDSIPPMLQNLEEYIETDQNIVEKSILHSLLAELYQMYFNTQQYKINRRTPITGYVPRNMAEWTVVSTDKKKAVGLIMQKHVIPNTQYACYRAKGLDEAKKYHFYNRKLQYDIKEFGELVNMVSPIHIKQGSMLQDILSKLKKMDGETEDYIAYGDTLMYSGVKLKQAFSATGYNENVRFFQDFAARLYFMEEVEDDKQ